MCFSPAASLAASAVLGAAGADALRVSRATIERPFAAVPMIFALQQAFEGIVWLTFGSSGGLHAFATYGFVLISHVFWPVYLPFAVMRLETDPFRRMRQMFFVVLGASVALPILYAVMRYPVIASVSGHGILYAVTIPSSAFTFACYVIATCIGCLFSSRSLVRLFGLGLAASFVVSYWFYQETLYSVWCFFAAILSLIVWVHARSGAPKAQA